MTEFILNLIAWGGYFGIFLLMALENILPPIPSEVIMGLGGMAVARGDMAMVPLLLWGRSRQSRCGTQSRGRRRGVGRSRR